MAVRRCDACEYWEDMSVDEVDKAHLRRVVGETAAR